MRRRDFPSLAEYYRAHRRAFDYALAHGCTPKEAERELARRDAFARNEQACARLAAKMNAPTPRLARGERMPPLAMRAGHDPESEQRREPWWQRED